MASKKVWVKVHHSRTGEVVVAACDEDLLGKKIKISREVYQGGGDREPPRRGRYILSG